MKIEKIRDTIILLVGLGAALYMELQGERETALSIGSATIFVYWMLV